MKKKIMLLGGLRYLLPVIEKAHEKKYHVITVDYLPDNIAHKYSDEYYNISTFDKESILKKAQERGINGILSYAVDAGVVSAAYVAEMMDLPFQCSYKSTCILQDKSLFRQFLFENGFNTPKAKGYSKLSDAMQDIDFFTWPVIVKPVDSCGSKGVTKVEKKEDFESAIKSALSVSVGKRVIVEDFLIADGSQSGSESFFVNGKLKYNAFYDQLFDNEAPNPYVPAYECWPSVKSSEILCEVKNELQRLGDLLGFKTGIFNVEWRISGGKLYLMEVSPRAGGNRLAEILNYATDVDIIDAELQKSLGDTCEHVHEPNYNGYYSIYNIHPDSAGLYKGIVFDKLLEKFLVEKEIRVDAGNKIEQFTGANSSIGTLFLRFSSREEMNNVISNMRNLLKVLVE